MSIQQTLNSMLMSAQIGAGLYAHSPIGQAQAEYKQAKKEYQKTEDAYSQWSGPLTEDETKIYEQMSQRQANLASEIYSIKPTPENYKTYKETLGGLIEDIKDPKADTSVQSAEAKALTSLSNKIGSLTERLQAFENRKSIIKKKSRGGKK